MNIEDTIIMIYCCVSEIVDGCGKLRTRVFQPTLSDAEVPTMEIVGELQGRDGDKAIWRYFSEHWQAWFPKLGSCKNFAKQCANIQQMKEKILTTLFPASSNLHIIDGVPMPVCNYARSYRSKSLKEYASYGLRGHPVINEQGYIVHCTYTDAKEDERKVLDNLRSVICSLNW